MNNILPFDYKELDYIETDGASYIDTLYVPSQNIRVNLKLKTPASIPTASTTLFYSGSGSSFYGFALSSSTISGKYKVFFRSGVFNGEYLDTLTDYEIDFNKSNFYLNNELLYEFDSTITFTCPYTLPIFCQYYASTKAINFAPNGTRVYFAKIYDDGELVRDLIPCIRVSDNEVGFYDKVNDVFYENLGTGSFTYGKVIDNPIKDVVSDINEFLRVNL